MAFFKTILAVLFRTFGLPPRFLSVKPSFLYDHLTTQHSDFSIVLGISLTEKPVNRNTCFCSHVAECFFSLRGFIFQDIHTKQVRSSSISGYKMPKIYGRKIYSNSAPLARNYTNRISSEKMAQGVWNIKLDWKSRLWLNHVLIKSNCTALQTYKVQERTFGTPCNLQDEMNCSTSRRLFPYKMNLCLLI